MLPPKNRLSTKRDFEEVKKKGQKFQTGIFGLLVYWTATNSSRFGFIISSKLSKKATKRNRAKRLLREAVRTILPKIKTGFDIIFLGKKDVLGKSLIEIQVEVKRMLEKAGVINAENKK